MTDATHGTTPVSTEGLPALDLHCLGAPAARVGGEPAPAEVLWRKNFALLTYLALAPDRTHTREHLIGLLWPEKDQSKARRSLNEAVRRLRGVLGAGRLVTDGNSITLCGAGLHVDALEVLRGEVEVEGEFLEGWVIDDAPEFDRWLAAQRTRFGSLSTERSLHEGEAALAQGDWRSAAVAARRALEVDPFAERAVRLAMMSYALAGDASRALAEFAAFRDRLSGELGEDASRDLSELAERIRSERWRGKGTDSTFADPPLVGRAREHRMIFQEVERALESGPRCIVVTGEQGVGQSRIVRECVKRAAMGGAFVAQSQPLETDHDTPYSTLRLLLQQLSEAPGVMGAAPKALAVLTAVEPQIASSAGSSTSPRDVADVASALRDLLQAVAEEQPVMLAIDDAEFADGATAAALLGAVRGLEDLPVLWLLTCSADTDRVPRELLTVRTEVGRSLQGVAISLGRLELEDVEQLVEAMAPWCTDLEQQNRVARRLTFDTEGNPLFLVTLLRALQQEDELRDDCLVWPIPRGTMSTPLPIALPDLVRSAIALRWDSLAPPTAHALRAASMLGEAIDMELVATMIGETRDVVETAFIEAERAGFVVYRGGRLLIAAPIIAAAIREYCTTGGERRRLRARAMEVLEGVDDVGAQVERARILAEDGRDEEAFPVALDAARAAIAEGASRTARRSLSLARRVAAPGDVTAVQELEGQLEQASGH